MGGGGSGSPGPSPWIHHWFPVLQLWMLYSPNNPEHHGTIWSTTDKQWLMNRMPADCYKKKQTNKQIHWIAIQSNIISLLATYKIIKKWNSQVRGMTGREVQKKGLLFSTTQWQKTLDTTKKKRKKNDQKKKHPQNVVTELSIGRSWMGQF